MVRFSPRQFELKPGESQLVRLATRLPPTLARGEYRFPLRVNNIGETIAAPTPSNSEAVQAQIRIQVTRAVRILVRTASAPAAPPSRASPPRGQAPAR